MEGLIFGILRYPGDLALLKNRHIKSITPYEGMRILESRIILACRIRNPGLWNPEYSVRNPESY